METRLFAGILVSGIYFYYILISFLRYRSAQRPVPEDLAECYPDDTCRQLRQYHTETHRLILTYATSLYLFLIICITTGLLGKGIDLLPDSPVLRSFAAMFLYALILYASGCFLRRRVRIRSKYGISSETWEKNYRSNYLLLSVLMLGYTFFLSLRSFSRPSGSGPSVFSRPLFWFILFLAYFCLRVILPVLRLIGSSTRFPEGALNDRIGQLIRDSGLKHCILRRIRIRKDEKLSGRALSFFGYHMIFLSFGPDVEQNEGLLCAIAAHEIGHCVRKHRLASVLLLLGYVSPFLALWRIIAPSGLSGEVYTSLHDGYILPAFLVCFFLVYPALRLVNLFFQRFSEYEADAWAVSAGYGNEMIQVIIQIVSRFQLPNPHPLLVMLTYSHPPAAERLRAVRSLINQKPPRHVKKGQVWQ